MAHRGQVPDQPAISPTLSVMPDGKKLSGHSQHSRVRLAGGQHSRLVHPGIQPSSRRRRRPAKARDRLEDEAAEASGEDSPAAGVGRLGDQRSVLVPTPQLDSTVGQAQAGTLAFRTLQKHLVQRKAVADEDCEDDKYEDRYVADDNDDAMQMLVEGGDRR